MFWSKTVMYCRLFRAFILLGGRVKETETDKEAITEPGESLFCFAHPFSSSEDQNQSGSNSLENHQSDSVDHSTLDQEEALEYR